MTLVLFTGGARSGKSAAAQKLALRREQDGAHVCVVVFGRDTGGDPEFSQRIERHRADRPASWTTVEASATTGWLEQVPDGATVLLDCVGTLLGLAMEEAYDSTATSLTETDLVDAAADELPEGYAAAVVERFDAPLRALLERHGDTIVVTNEVGDGVIPSHATGRVFRDVLGQANRRLVTVSDAAYLCVAGALVNLSALPREAAWPED